MTWLGSGWVVYPLGAHRGGRAGATGGSGGSSGCSSSAWSLIAIFVPAIKEWTDRPRPPDPLVSTASHAFPSGHAAHAVLYTWLAVTFALGWCRGSPGGAWWSGRASR